MDLLLAQSASSLDPSLSERTGHRRSQVCMCACTVLVWFEWDLCGLWVFKALLARRSVFVKLFYFYILFILFFLFAWVFCGASTALEKLEPTAFFSSEIIV